MPETWKPVPASRMLGVPAGYEASTEGRARHGSLILAPWRDKDGYQVIRLGRRNVRLHVAVQLAFAGPPEVRHLDGDHENNRPGNLAWGSRVENEQDKRKAGRKKGGTEGASLRGELGHLGRGGLR